jgi:CRP-like cAMP-binding protein
LKPQPRGRAIAQHDKGDIIFSSGDAADAVFYITKGKIRVTVLSKQGKEAVVAILGTDEFVGEGCLIGQPKRLATGTALSECVTMRVDKTEILRLLRDGPTFSQMFVSQIWRGQPVSKKIWLISYSIPQRSDLLDAIAVSEFRQGRSARTAYCKDHPGSAR